MMRRLFLHRDFIATISINSQIMSGIRGLLESDPDYPLKAWGFRGGSDLGACPSQLHVKSLVSLLDMVVSRDWGTAQRDPPIRLSLLWGHPPLPSPKWKGHPISGNPHNAQLGFRKFGRGCRLTAAGFKCLKYRFF